VKILNLDHIGIAVKSLTESSKFYELLGIKSTGTEEVAEQKVKVAFFPVGDSEVELLESTSPDGPMPNTSKRTVKGFSISPCAWMTLRRRLPS